MQIAVIIALLVEASFNHSCSELGGERSATGFLWFILFVFLTNLLTHSKYLPIQKKKNYKK